MKRVLRIMVDIFQPEGIDWMNFALSRDNPFTYHHIVEKSKGGDKSIDNGAILTRRAHTFLHTLEKVCPDAYNDLQNVFFKINESKKPVLDEYIKEIDEILYKVLISHEYEYVEDIDLSNYNGLYFEGRKRLKKCLK